MNATLVGAALAAGTLLFAVVPLALLPFSPWWGLLLVPVALSSNFLWSLLHEAIHGLLFGDRRANDLCGRAMGIAFGAPFRCLRAGHPVALLAAGSPAGR
jgi:fatty acid desaturase